MNSNPQAIRGDVDGMVRRYEYDENELLVADFGAVEGSVEVVGETAIVVVDDDQYDFDVPDGTSRAIMNNGVVTIEVEDTR